MGDNKIYAGMERHVYEIHKHCPNCGNQECLLHDHDSQFIFCIDCGTQWTEEEWGGNGNRKVYPSLDY